MINYLGEVKIEDKNLLIVDIYCILTDRRRYEKMLSEDDDWNSCA